jgi:hypothetical protein
MQAGGVMYPRDGEKPMSPKYRVTVAAAAVLACAIAPTGAAARGGSGSGGGGGTTPSGTPCVTMSPTNTGKKFNRNATIDARFGVANCGSAPITVTSDATSMSTAWSSTAITPTPLPCPGPSASAGALTLKPGEQRSVQFSFPPTTCPLGPGGAIVQVDATARDAARAPLAAARAYYKVTLETL